MELLRKLWDCSWGQRYLILKAALLIGIIRLALRLLPFRTVERAFTRPPREYKRTSRDDERYKEGVVRAVRAVARQTLGDKPCLPQALAAQWLLRRAGYATTLRIGVTKGEEGQLLAHAWMESEGEIVIGGRSSRIKYTPLGPAKASSADLAESEAT